MLRKIGASALFLTVGTMLNKVAILAINVLLAQFTSTEVYGKFALLRNTVNLVETTLSSSINPIVISESAKAYGDASAYSRVNTFLLMLGILVAVAVSIPLWIFDDYIAHSLLNEPAPQFVRLGILLLLTTNISGLLSSFLVTGHATIHLPIASISAALVAVLMAYLFIPGNPIYWAILSIIILHGFELSIKLGIAVWKKIVAIRGLGRFQIDTFSVFSTSLVILITSSAINALAFWLLRVMIVNVNDSFTQLALFDVSFQYLAVEMMVLNNIITIFQSRLASQIGGDGQNLRRTFISGIQLVALGTIVASLVNLVFADFLIGIYGESYDPQVLRLLTLVLPLYAISAFMNRTFVSIGRQWVLLLVSVVSSIVALLYAQLFLVNAYQLVLAFVVYFGVSIVVYSAVVMHLRMTAARGI